MDIDYVTYVTGKLVHAIIPISICVILPITIVRLIIRERINRDNTRKDIILAAMEKNTDIDIEAMMKKLNGSNEPKKLLKEKLMTKLLVGSVMAGFGVFVYVAMAVYIWLHRFNNDMFICLSFAAVPALAIGIAFLINYFIGKKMLAKEMEAEEHNLRQA